MIIIGCTITDGAGLKDKSRRAWLRGLVKEALHDTAAYWHASIFPRHFANLNRTRYGFAPRTPFYLKVVKPHAGQGAGRFTDLLLSGRSRRFMLYGAKISGTHKRQTVSMRPPAWFTRPFIGVLPRRPGDKPGKVRRISRQPDKPDEATRVSTQDREDLREYMANRVQQLMRQNSAPSANTTTVTL